MLRIVTSVTCSFLFVLCAAASNGEANGVKEITAGTINSETKKNLEDYSLRKEELNEQASVIEAEIKLQENQIKLKNLKNQDSVGLPVSPVKDSEKAKDRKPSNAIDNLIADANGTIPTGSVSAQQIIEPLNAICVTKTYGKVGALKADIWMRGARYPDMVIGGHLPEEVFVSNISTNVYLNHKGKEAIAPKCDITSARTFGVQAKDSYAIPTIAQPFK